MPESDKSLPENSKRNLDQKLDHAIEETFPTSDPVSVQITKGRAIDYDERGQGTPSSSGTAEGLMDQAKETLGSVAGSASETAQTLYEEGSRYARDASNQGRRYAREAADRYPQARRAYEESRRMTQAYAPENPLLTLLAGAAIGYALAWLIHGHWRRDDERVPDYARTRRGFRP